MSSAPLRTMLLVALAVAPGALGWSPSAPSRGVVGGGGGPLGRGPLLLRQRRQTLHRSWAEADDEASAAETPPTAADMGFDEPMRKERPDIGEPTPGR